MYCNRKWKLPLRTDGDVDDHEEEQQLRHFHCNEQLEKGICRAHNGHDNLVQELHLCMTSGSCSTICGTGMSRI